MEKAKRIRRSHEGQSEAVGIIVHQDRDGLNCSESVRGTKYEKAKVFFTIIREQRERARKSRWSVV